MLGAVRIIHTDSTSIPQKGLLEPAELSSLPTDSVSRLYHVLYFSGPIPGAFWKMSIVCNVLRLTKQEAGLLRNGKQRMPIVTEKRSSVESIRFGMNRVFDRAPTVSTIRVILSAT